MFVACVSVRWATTGQQWTQLFAFLNSGTYNNQWVRSVPPPQQTCAYSTHHHIVWVPPSQMVVDTSLFTPGQALADGVLYILEQIPVRLPP